MGAALNAVLLFAMLFAAKGGVDFLRRDFGVVAFYVVLGVGAGMTALRLSYRRSARSPFGVRQLAGAFVWVLGFCALLIPIISGAWVMFQNEIGAANPSGWLKVLKGAGLGAALGVMFGSPVALVLGAPMALAYFVLTWRLAFTPTGSSPEI